jgi:hypothetical protein
MYRGGDWSGDIPGYLIGDPSAVGSLRHRNSSPLGAEPPGKIRIFAFRHFQSFSQVGYFRGSGTLSRSGIDRCAVGLAMLGEFVLDQIEQATRGFRG